MRRDHGARPGLQCQPGECALARRRLRVALDAPVEARDHDVGTAPRGTHVVDDVRGRGPPRARVPRSGGEGKRQDVGEADERDRQAEATDDARPRRVGRVEAGADAEHAGPADPGDGVRRSERTVVAEMIVGEIHHIQAGESREGPQVGGIAPEVVLLGHGCAAVRDRALEVAERDVGRVEHRRDVEPRPARTAAGHHRTRSVAQIDVADRPERDVAQTNPDWRGRRGPVRQRRAEAESSRRTRARPHRSARSTERVGHQRTHGVPVANRSPLDHDPSVRRHAADRERDAQAGGELGRCGEPRLRGGLPRRHRPRQDEGRRPAAARRQ